MDLKGLDRLRFQTPHLHSVHSVTRLHVSQQNQGDNVTDHAITSGRFEAIMCLRVCQSCVGLCRDFTWTVRTSRFLPIESPSRYLVFFFFYRKDRDASDITSRLTPFLAFEYITGAQLNSYTFHAYVCMCMCHVLSLYTYKKAVSTVPLEFTIVLARYDILSTFTIKSSSSYIYNCLSRI